MGRRRKINHTTTIALCLSMAAHALGLSALAWWFIYENSPVRVAAATEAEVARLTPLPPPAPPPRPKRQRPMPTPEPFDPIDPMHKDDSGEHDGHGTANRSTPGDQPMQAERGYEQADLVRAKPADPSLIDPAAARAAQAGRATRDDALPLSPTPAQHGTYRPDFAAASDAANADPAGELAKPAAARGLGPLPPSPVLSPPVDDAPAAASGVQQSVVKSSDSTAAPPPAKEVRGRQATASDTESPPFAKDATVDFHAGRMDGRQGLKVQMYAPHWGLASENDLYAMGELYVALGAHIRPDGSVAQVEVLKSSGSANVDLDCERAVYAGTFEPRKDKDGHPVATLWTVVYH